VCVCHLQITILIMKYKLCSEGWGGAGCCVLCLGAGLGGGKNRELSKVLIVYI